MRRELNGYWWTWREGDDWPSWYYAEKTARETATHIARMNPGVKVSLGRLERVETILLPDKLEIVSG